MPRRRSLLAALAVLPAACRSPDPKLYTLEIVPGRQLSGAPAVIELRSIGLARYLERSQIVRSSEDFRLDVLGADWWGEPLDALLGRVLVQELTERLPGSTVFSDNGAISITPDATVAVNVQRFDLDRTGVLLLIAQVAVSGRRTTARTVRLTEPPKSPETSDLVGAMSLATGRLADAIAEMLTRR